MENDQKFTVILALSAWNRWGSPQTSIALTERELAMPFREEENSGLLLSLTLGDEAPLEVIWVARQRRYRLPRAEHPWLDDTKLRELGFPPGKAHSDSSGSSGPSSSPEENAEQGEGNGIARRAFVVLEFEGEAWKQWLTSQESRLTDLRRKVEEGGARREELENAEAVLALDRTMRSRPLPVDAGTDGRSLRSRYAAQERFLVVPAILTLTASPEEGRPARLDAVIEPLVSRLHVPAALRPAFTPFLRRETGGQAFESARKQAETGWLSPAPPRYRVTLAYCRGFEPWIVGVEPLVAGSSGQKPPE